MKKVLGIRLIGGLVGVFAVFQWTAATLESNRGEYGVAVGLVVVAAILFVQRVLFCSSVTEAALSLGLGLPNARSIAVTAVICILMFSSFLLFVYQTESSFSFYPGWQGLVPGLFFQAGIAEETLFRGYLFGHMRQRYTFWKAAIFAAAPFTAVHLILFFSLDWALAAASILLSVAISFPLSKLFELGGRTIWAPAILHFVVQAIPKLIVFEGGEGATFPLVWIGTALFLSFLVFLVPARENEVVQ
ncbi:MAG: CPBP family intramembrane metalloprotease [Acidobacteria bacterium]|nr:CPBP family intramembrane metalloprotease [Acidobacteriota bacterium]